MESAQELALNTGELVRMPLRSYEARAMMA